MIDAEKFNRQEDRLRTLGIGVMIGFSGIAAFLVWLR